MSGKSTVSLIFKIEDVKGGLKKFTADADAFRKMMQASVKEVDKLRSRTINFAAMAHSIDSANKSLSDLQQIFGELTAANAAQVEAEKKLENAMRNSMGAADAWLS